MKLETFIALKQVLAKGKKRNMISFMGLISIFGVFLGVAVPIIVMSVFSGFQEESKRSILGVGNHVTIMATYEHGMKHYRNITEKIRSMPEVKAVVPYIETQGLLQAADEYQPVVIRAVDYNFFTNDKDFFNTVTIPRGSKDISLKNRIMIGNELAKRNFFGINERVQLVTAQNSSLYNISPEVIRTMIVGTFKSGYYEYDNGIIFASLPTLQEPLGLEGSVSRIGIKLHDIWHTDRFINKLHKQAPGAYNAYSWKELNRNIFKALAMEKVIMWLVVILILIVATFNIMGTQIMMVLEKRKDIGILKTLGMKPAHVYKIFLIQNMFITFTGAVTGAVAGTLGSIYITRVITGLEWVINLFSRAYHFLLSLVTSGAGPFNPVVLFPKGVYYFNHIPTDVDPMRAVIMLTAALIMAVVAGFLPSLLAARLRPLEVIRYE